MKVSDKVGIIKIHPDKIIVNGTPNVLDITPYNMTICYIPYAPDIDPMSCYRGLYLGRMVYSILACYRGIPGESNTTSLTKWGTYTWMIELIRTPRPSTEP